MAMKKKVTFANVSWVDIANSSSVQRIAYDKSTKRLFVTFQGGKEGYYDNVPVGHYNELIAANSNGESVGSLLHALIKAEAGKFPWTAKLGDN